MVVYHVTPLRNVAGIREKGLRWRRRPATTGNLGQDIRHQKGVYAFTEVRDALRWCFRLGWDGKAAFAVVKLDHAADWQDDAHFEASGAEGRWVWTAGPLPPGAFLGAHTFDLKALRGTGRSSPDEFLYAALPEGF